ncbi:hypothetical protein NliqN6_2012 [Naganishia liquefaciens]|uniref:HIT domain-containing protein n=1 Tax=Naganishia liquefaciens TaxID=104408 RepID=A0A8H3TR04_9TREE|nr:hypothetical protein NliqN6_2012 [Naganishia liquefaciens]
MLDALARCLGLTPRAYADLEGGGTAKGCVFCRVTPENGFDMVESNDEMIAFRDRNPGAAQHLLIIPRRHISTVKDLQPHDIPLLTRMESLGARLLSSFGVPPEEQRLGYHIPPFSSVHHLHLHALSLPLKSWWRRLKYRPTTRGDSRAGKRWGWFVTNRDAMGILSEGKRIGITSS